MSTGPAGPAGPAGATAAGVLTAEDAWRKLMYRIGVTNPRLVKLGALALDGVDRMTHTNSKALPR